MSEKPRPPCGVESFPAYPALDVPPVVVLWTEAELAGWSPPACTTWKTGSATLVVGLAGRFRDAGGYRTADGKWIRMGLLYRSDMFVAVDNTVTLPGYTRADAALFYAMTDKLRLQLNVENLFDARYFINADSNTNISPGSPRVLRVALTTRF